MLDKDLEKTLNQAFQTARMKRHEYLTVEHLLLALLENLSALKVLSSCGANIEQLKLELVSFVDDTTPKLPKHDAHRDTQPTLGFQRVLQRAVFHVQSSGRTQVTGANVLVAIFSEQDSQAVFFLKQQNISRLDIVNCLTHGSLNPSEKSSDGDSAESSSNFEPDADGSESTSSGGSPLKQYTINLNERAKSGKIDLLVGREDEVLRVEQIICRRRKNNPLLVGEAGVGKTAIAEGLARKIVDGQVPSVIANSVVYALDLGAMLAGTKYRGDFEKRFKAVLKQLQDEKGAILFIDEIHTIIGAGAASGAVMDASNLLKPLLTSGELRCIGSTTYQEYRNIFEKDHALARRFQKVDILEPTPDQAYQILKGLRGYFEKHHEISYTDAALRAAVDLSVKHMAERFLPDKAIDVIDEAGAYWRLEKHVDKKIIDVNDIEKTVSKIVRVPMQTVSASDRQSLQNLERDLKLMVYGQDDAIRTLVSTIKLSRAGLREPNKPWGSFLLAGPTGVGKTEVTQQLAKLMGVELIRFDMSEYMEAHAVSRLIGAPPGYVGYDQGGLLTDAVHKHPYCIVLLDEIEKAHPDLFNLMLQVMDNGTLTDNNGRKSDFRHALIIMTTNAGAFESARNSMGFIEQDNSTDSMDAINRLFSPEFRNRLDAVIPFRSLDPEDVINVVNKFISQLQGYLDAQGVSLEVSDEARRWLAEKGYDRKMGARPMGRVIQQQLKQPLAEEILFGQLSSGGHAKASLENEQIIFEFSNKKSSTRKKTLQADPSS